MKLTAQDDPRAIQRYRHIKPARGFGVLRCGKSCPGTSRRCTLAQGHRGPHVAHGLLGRVLAVWESAARASSVRPPNPPGGRRSPIGIRRGTSDGLGASIWRAMVRVASSAEEIALLVFLLAFVYFAIDWLRLIFQ
ncbi:MAG: hypothetical protein OEN56_10890 [Gemmatimonadota bacterium]|nr:hypothetical protein [Gemmatimonadota bacterium]